VAEVAPEDQARVQLPETWTPEQVQQFQEAWDDLAFKHHARWLPPGPQPMVVVHLWWTEGSIPRQETYGPWIVADNEAHLAQIQDFLRDWRAVTGCPPDVATMALVMDPAAWVHERAATAAGPQGEQ
jgi:hypothetical protein